MWKFVILAFDVAMGTPVAADGFPPRPQSCELVSTAQHSDCEVENRYKCASGGTHSFRIEFFDTEGMTGISHETADYVPEDTFEADGSGLFVTSAEGLHPRDMLSAGTSTHKLEGYVSILGLQQPFLAVVQFTATGKTIVLAETTFDTIEGNVLVTMPNAGAEFSGRSIVAYQPELDLMIETETSFGFGAPETTFVKELALPGQPGFGDEFPKYGCINLSLHSLQPPSVHT